MLGEKALRLRVCDDLRLSVATWAEGETSLEDRVGGRGELATDNRRMDAVTRTTGAPLGERGGRTSLSVEAETEEVGAFESPSVTESLGAAVPEVSIRLSEEEEGKVFEEKWASADMQADELFLVTAATRRVGGPTECLEGPSGSGGCDVEGGSPVSTESARKNIRAYSSFLKRK
ncbi:unnamed protein product [Haemonchus placei]|uniref:Uncharacterized protein n=1 Tax=Haemonchus placei TaxID=6290 RepID=A0A0N4WAG0_HAEPC|nr:unnamed protein product [Haemonchus placei]